MRASFSIVILTVAALAGCSSDETGKSPAGGSKPKVSAAAATLETLAGVEDGLDMFKGEATFSKTATGVNLQIELMFCKDKGNYLFHIEDAESCAELTGEPWDGARGEIKMRAPCYGTGGATFERRDDDAPKPWTIGGAARSNVIGRVLVMSDFKSKRTLACGKIAKAAAGDAGTSVDAGADDEDKDEDDDTDEGKDDPSLAIRAHVAGMCQTDLIAHSGSEDCPMPEKVAGCAKESCQLDACLTECRSYTECLEKDTGDWCVSTCERSEGCWDCMGRMITCMFSFCEDALSCAAPAAPNGPCRKLEKCCRMQRTGVEACLELLARTEKISGDPSCAGLLEDDAFQTDLVNDPRCDELDL